MPLVISTTNTVDQNLAAIIDRVTTAGVLIDPPERWNATDEIWEDPDSISSEDEQLTLSEELPGYYTQTEEDIDGPAENLRIMIVEQNTGVVVGVYYNLATSFSAPEVVIDLTVTEDRN